MKKIMGVIIVNILLAINLFANDLDYFKNLLKRDGIDYDIKSCKNWIRVLNNKDLLKKYGIHISSQEIKISRFYLENHLKMEKRERGMK